MPLNVITWRQSLLLFFLLACIASMLLAPISSNLYIPELADYSNHIAAIIQAKLALTAGQFPLRVTPLEENGWQYPFYQFYSPSSYTFAGLIYHWITPSNPFIAYKLTIWCALMIGGIYIYRLAFWFVESIPAATLASVVYLTSPYYIVVINHFGAFNEAIALGIVPPVLYYTLQRYYDSNKNITLLQMGLFWYLLATIHLITFAYTSLFVALLLLLLSLKQQFLLKNLLPVGIAYIFSCLLAIWYLAPIALFGKYMAVSNSIDHTIIFDTYGTSFLNLISPAANITSGNNTGSIMLHVHPSIGLPMLFTIAICFYLLLRKRTTNTKPLHYWFMPLLAIYALAFFAAWSPVDFWQWLPRPFWIIQYSWRLLGQTMWCGALLFAWLLCRVFKNNIDDKKTALGLLLLVTSTQAWLPITEMQLIPLAPLINNPKLVFNTHSYLMTIATRAKPPKTIEVTRTRTHCQPQSRGMLCKIAVPAQTPLLELPVLYYPKMLRIIVNGKSTAYTSTLYQQRAIVAIAPQAGKINNIEIQFAGLRWANFVSQIAWGAWLLLLLFITMQALLSKKKSLTPTRIPYAERVSVHIRIRFRRPP